MPEEATHSGAHPLVNMQRWSRDHPEEFEGYIERMCEWLDVEYRELCQRAA